MDSSIDQAFGVLADRHSFVRVAMNGSVSYRSPLLLVSPSFDERDGFDTILRFPTCGTDEIAVGTVLAALDVAKTYDVQSHISFLTTQLPKLVSLPLDVYRDLSALRFWHARRWRTQWGHGITMDRDSIVAEKARLNRIREYFSGSCGK